MSAQDVITLRNADEINAKVLKITQTEIEYKKQDNPDGPVYTIPVADVFFIKYQNGSKDIFAEAPVAALAPMQQQQQGGRYEYDPRLATGAGPAHMHMPGQHMIRPPRFKHHNEKYPYYQGEFAVGYGIGMGAVSRVINTNRIVFETVHGARICPYFFAGAGLGLNYFNSEIPIYYDDSAIGEYQGALVLPVFANAKGYLPLSGKCALYLSLDLGAAIPIGGWADGTTQFYTSVGPGINFGNGKGRARGDFSIRFQHMGEGLNAMLFRIGIGF